jgi:hypothetical protein
MFKQEARWDRNLPGDTEGGWEPVEVFAKFLKGRIIPLYFVLSGNRFNISRINYVWNQRKGRTVLYYFSVADKNDTYRLCFNSEAMSWHLIANS